MSTKRREAKYRKTYNFGNRRHDYCVRHSSGPQCVRATHLPPAHETCILNLLCVQVNITDSVSPQIRCMYALCFVVGI